MVFLSNDVHHSCNGIATIESRRCSLHDFDSLNVVRVDEPEVVLSSHIAMNALAVDEDENVVVAQTIHPNLPIDTTPRHGGWYDDAMNDIIADQMYEDELAAEARADMMYEEEMQAELMAECMDYDDPGMYM